jgi:ABC-type Fe3+ transport system substrate-binding protein
MLRLAQLIAVVYLLVAVGLSAWSFRPAPDPVTVEILYGTEKEDWLEAAAERFAATNPTVDGAPIEIVLEGMGSRAQALDVATGEVQPTVISPASSIWTEVLRDEWATRNNGDTILFEGADAPQPLVITPLVIVIWDDRAEALGLEASERIWDELHQLVSSPTGWADFGHPDWGFARWAHTNPETSNSGAQTVVLLAYAYHDKAEGLENADILDPDFQAWFDDFEEAVPEFIGSTGTLMDNMLRFGPSQYNFVVVYENLAIENFEVAQGRGGPIRVYYPPINILSDHPYAILDAEWVSPQQREAAALFRDYLLSPEMQQLALEFGFRPGNTDVAFDVAGGPFERYADRGIQKDVLRTAEVPPANVINELIDLWRRGDYD